MKHYVSKLLFLPLLAVVACSGSGSNTVSGNNAFDSGLAPSASSVGSSWAGIDIGSSSGSTTLGTGSFTLSGMGKFESSAQTFHYEYVTVTGDFTITAKLDSFTGASSNQGWAGLMLAPSLTTTGTNFLFAASSKRGDGTYYYGYRLSSGASLTKNSMSKPSTSGSSVYLKLSRSGNSFSSSYSLDGGSTWGAATTGSFSSLATTVNVGLIVNSGSNSAAATAVFSNVVITDGSGTVITGGGSSSTTVSVTGVALGQSALSLTTGSTGQLSATISPSDATNQNVTWASNNTAVATVSSTGLVTAVNAGSATVTVTTADGSFAAACTVTVTSSSSGGGSTTTGPTKYISPTGTGDGSSSSSPTTLSNAIAAAMAGDTLIMAAGTYSFSTQITIPGTANGTADSMITLTAASGATVVLDFSSQPYGKTSSVSNPRGIQINGDYWHLKNLEIKGSADNGIYIAGNHNIIEACTVHGNRDSGLQIGRESSSLTSKADWPSYNLILNCESYDNYDCAPNAGENADGFACKLTTGPGNVFRGCISHNNIDDGWDLYTKSETGAIDPVVLDQCIAFRNGTLTDGTQNPAGDKNGFKLGGEDIAVVHVVTRCISFLNGKNGFTWNSNPGAIRLVNNTAWDNVEGNFKFDNTSAAIFVNNLSFWISSSSQVSDRAGANSGTIIANNCFWDKSKKCLSGVTGVTSWSSADLQSTTMTTTFPLPRNSDGSFNLGSFGKLVSTSSLIDKGVLPSTKISSESGIPDLPIGSDYYNGAPDIGAKEYK